MERLPTTANSLTFPFTCTRVPRAGTRPDCETAPTSAAAMAV